MKPVCLHTPIPPIEKIQNPSWDMLTCGCQVPIRRDRHMYETEPDSDAVLAQFNRLILELLRGNMRRNTFRPWEVELLLDIEGCNLRESAKRETLKRYQKAVQKHMEKGARLPLKLTEYL